MIMLRIEIESREAVHGGGCADIYRGFLNQHAIALKVLRIFNEADMKAVLPACPGFSNFIVITDFLTGIMQGSHSLEAA